MEGNDGFLAMGNAKGVRDDEEGGLDSEHLTKELDLMSEPTTTTG